MKKIAADIEEGKKEKEKKTEITYEKMGKAK